MLRSYNFQSIFWTKSSFWTFSTVSLGEKPHLQSARFRYILEAMELASQPPEISFHAVTLIGGMELIEAARGA